MNFPTKGTKGFQPDALIDDMRKRLTRMTSREAKFFTDYAPKTKEFFSNYYEKIHLPFLNMKEQVNTYEELLDVESERIKKETNNWAEFGKHHFSESSVYYITGQLIIDSLTRQIEWLNKQVALYNRFVTDIEGHLGKYGLISKELNKVVRTGQLLKPEEFSKEEKLKEDIENQSLNQLIQSFKALTVEEIKLKLKEHKIIHIHPLEVKYLDFIPYRPLAAAAKKPLPESSTIGGGNLIAVKEFNQYLNNVAEEVANESLAEFIRRYRELYLLAPTVWSKRTRAELYIYHTQGLLDKRDIIYDTLYILRNKLGGNINTENIKRASGIALKKIKEELKNEKDT